MLRIACLALCAALCVLLPQALALASDPFVAVEAEMAAAKAFPASPSPVPKVDPLNPNAEEFEARVNRILANRPPGDGWNWDEKTQSYWRPAQPQQQPAPVTYGYQPAYAPAGTYGYMGAGYYAGDGGMMVCGPNGCGPTSGFGNPMMVGAGPMMGGAGVCGPGGCGPSGGRVAFRRR